MTKKKKKVTGLLVRKRKRKLRKFGNHDLNVLLVRDSSKNKKLNVGNFFRSYQSMMANTRRRKSKLVKQEKRPGLSEVVMV